MSIDPQKIISWFNFQKDKRLFAVLGGALFLIILANFFIGFIPNNIKKPAQVLTIPAIGNLRPLDIAMSENKNIRNRVKQILSYDEVYLFVNYRQVNGVVAEILFLWAEMTPEQLQEMKGREAIDYFLRYIYGLPKDEPIQNNPLLGVKPWPTLFNRFKSKLLMQGQGYKVYDGLAYYDSEQDKMVIEGALSKPFVTNFMKFLKAKKTSDQKRYINNFLAFVNETKGLKSLSEEEKSMVRVLTQ